MAKIIVNLTEPLRNGMDIKFKAPCDCVAVTGLTVNYPTMTGSHDSKSLVFVDTHGNRLVGVGNLFMQGTYVKVMVDTTNGVAYIQNADTNGYLEGEFEKLRALHLDDGNGCFYRVVGEEMEWINPPMALDTEYRTTERSMGKPVYTALVSTTVSSEAFGWTFTPPAGSVSSLLRWSGYTSTGCTLPYLDYNTTSPVRRSITVRKTSTARISLSVGAGATVISANETWYVQVWYTKE